MAVGTRRVPTRVGRYDLLERIGKGAIGSVYRARDAETGATVAVKVLTATLAGNPTLADRFEREFRSAARLDHPNMVLALDFGHEAGFTYLVTEFVDGKTLGKILKEQGALPEEHAVRIVTQVAQALHYAHKHRVIHRDVKPDNILVRADGLAKLADFGLAKDIDDDRGLTATAACLGTPHFMAPEQYAEAKTAGVASDVYSLGATLYSAVTGRVPFDGCASLIALARKVKGDIPSPREVVPGLSPQVDDAVRRAMSPDPAKRPASCLQFVKLLPAPGKAAGGLLKANRPPQERRAAARLAHVIGTICVIDTAAAGGGPDTEESWSATVRDVSAGGVGLVLARRFEPGTVFSLQLGGGGRAAGRSLPVRVKRVRAEDLGHWFHGCAFVRPLTEKELANLY